MNVLGDIMKETQKQQIARLEKELKETKNQLEEYKTLCSNLNAEVLEMQQRADDSFSNSSDYQQMKKHIEFLEAKNKSLDKSIEHNEKVHKLINERRNSRNAGRKPRFTDNEEETIKMYRLQGKTIKEIADMFGCSVGLIHKVISENNNI